MHRLRLIIFLGALISWNTFLSCSAQNIKERPNILFAISDDQTFGHTSFAGAKWVSTPAFDRIAKEGIYFNNCYAGSPGCAPSRSSIVTGRYHWQNEQSGQHAAGWFDKYIPFVDEISGNGYHTGYTGKGVGPFKYGEAPLRSENAAGTVYNTIKYEEGGPDDERFASGIRNLNYFENFKKFIEEKESAEPFFFWYGASEPHRSYEKDSWKRRGKQLSDAEVPEFLPDDEVIRGDILDYAVEIEWFDLHLQRMIDYLEEIGELENTIIIVTADNGMPFPRAKANAYDFGAHVPMAIRYPKRFPGGRKVDNPVSFIDIAPTVLELTHTAPGQMKPISGQSLLPILETDEEGAVDGMREFSIYSRERHSSSRYKNRGYPQRAIRKGDYLLIWNMKPDRWPAGAPRRIVPDTDRKELYPMYGIDEDGIHHSEWAFTDIDACPTKSFMVENMNHPKFSRYLDWAVAKRPEFELFNVKTDPSNLNDLYGIEANREVQEDLIETLQRELEKYGDPRITGPDPEVFDTYPRYSPMRYFPKP